MYTQAALITVGESNFTLNKAVNGAAMCLYKSDSFISN